MDKHSYNFKDLTNQVFEKLTVIKFAGIQGTSSRSVSTWECRCSCENGTVIIVRAYNLKSGAVRSCGCLIRDTSGTHRLSSSPEYKTWRRIKNRCYRKKDDHYECYGERGIVACWSWRESFVKFLADMGKRPSKKHSIDRIDNNGHYSCGKCEECVANGWPANCRWATKEQQMRNKRSNHTVLFNDQIKTLVEWSEITGFSYNTLKSRLARGWSAKDTLTIPLLR